MSNCSSVNNNVICLNLLPDRSLDPKTPIYSFTTHQCHPNLESFKKAYAVQKRINASLFASSSSTKNSNPSKQAGYALLAVGGLASLTGIGAKIGIPMIAGGIALLSTGCGGRSDLEGPYDKIEKQDGGVEKDGTISSDSRQDAICADLAHDMYCSSPSFVLEKITDPSVEGGEGSVSCASINGPGDHIVWSPVVNDSPFGNGLFLYSRQTRQSKKISAHDNDLIASTGYMPNTSNSPCALDDSARRVAYELVDPITNSTNVMLYDNQDETTMRIDSGSFPAFSDDGQVLAYLSSSSETSDTSHIGIRNLETGATRPVPLPDYGRYKLGSNVSFLVHRGGESGELIRIDTTTNKSEILGRISNGYFSDMDGSGESIVFSNGTESTYRGPVEIFLFETSTGRSRLISDDKGIVADYHPLLNLVISRNGECVAWNSLETNPDGDTKRNYQIFVRHLPLGKTKMVSVSANGEAANTNVYLRGIDANCENLLYLTRATNLTDGCGNLLNAGEEANPYVVGLRYFFPQ